MSQVHILMSLVEGDERFLEICIITSLHPVVCPNLLLTFRLLGHYYSVSKIYPYIIFSTSKQNFCLPVDHKMLEFRIGRALPDDRVNAEFTVAVKLKVATKYVQYIFCIFILLDNISSR